MFMKKKIVSLLLTLSLVMVPSFVTASNDSLTEGDKERLSTFGFSYEEINNFTPEVYAVFNEKYGHDTVGELVEENVSFFKFENGKAEEVTEEEFNIGSIQTLVGRELKESLSLIQPASTWDQTDTGWLQMTTEVTKVVNWNFQWTGEYMIKNHFYWHVNPLYKLTDVVAISFNSNLTFVPNSDLGVYSATHTKLNPTIDNYTLYAQTKNTQGIGFNVDLKAYNSNGTSSTFAHGGWVSIKVIKNNTFATSTNAYGHYAHLYNTLTFSVSITDGSLSISGVTNKDYADDTGIAWMLD